MILLLFLSLFKIPLGALPETYKQYERAIDEQKGTFRCFSDNLEISLRRVNDGKADCADGSDEPGTKATKNDSFYCINEGYVPEIISNKLISDGICNCCDGSDEYFNHKIACPNTCKENEKIRKEYLERVFEGYKEGIKINEQRTKKIKDQLKYENKMMDALYTQINHLEEDKVKIMHRTTNNEETHQNKINEAVKTHPNSKPTEKNHNDEESKKLVEEKEETSAGPNIYENYQHFEGKDDGFVDILPKLEENKTDESKWRAIFRCIWHFTFHVPETKTTITERLNRKTLDNINNKINKKRQELIKLQENHGNDEIAPSFADVFGKLYKKDRYELLLMNEIKDGSVSLGNYEKMEGNKQFYEYGAYCSETNNLRNTTLELTCWKEEILLSVKEISKCRYYGVFATPAACTEESFVRIQNATIPQLQDILSSFDAN